MAIKKYINIDFPFRDSEEGFYFKLNSTNNSAIKSDLLHLLLTNKGERLYMPDFGSDLRKYIFEPNDDITHNKIKNNLNETINQYIPNLTIDSIKFEQDDIEELIIVKLSYTVTEDAFTTSDTIELIL
jgi:phage baseplate assembly protein W